MIRAFVFILVMFFSNMSVAGGLVECTPEVVQQIQSGNNYIKLQVIARAQTLLEIAKWVGQVHRDSEAKSKALESVEFSDPRIFDKYKSFGASDVTRDLYTKLAEKVVSFSPCSKAIAGAM